jgi:hypothetical protein
MYPYRRGAFQPYKETDHTWALKRREPDTRREYGDIELHVPASFTRCGDAELHVAASFTKCGDVELHVAARFTKCEDVELHMSASKVWSI